jgi:hypothetical protein
MVAWMPGAYLPFPVDSSIAMGTSNDECDECDEDECDECDECDDDTFLLEASGRQTLRATFSLSRYTKRERRKENGETRNKKRETRNAHEVSLTRYVCRTRAGLLATLVRLNPDLNTHAHNGWGPRSAVWGVHRVIASYRRESR